VNSTPPRAQSPLVKAGSPPPQLASPVESLSKQQRPSRLSLLSFRRGNSTSHARTHSTKHRPLESTAEERFQSSGARARAASAAATAATVTTTTTSILLDDVAEKKKINGTHVAETGTDTATDRPNTRQSDYSHGEDSIARGGAGVKKRFSFIGITGQVGGKVGRRPSKSSVE